MHDRQSLPSAPARQELAPPPVPLLHANNPTNAATAPSATPNTILDMASHPSVFGTPTHLAKARNVPRSVDLRVAATACGNSYATFFSNATVVTTGRMAATREGLLTPSRAGIPSALGDAKGHREQASDHARMRSTARAASTSRRRPWIQQPRPFPPVRSRKLVILAP